jgi:hypothetical protein
MHSFSSHSFTLTLISLCVCTLLSTIVLAKLPATATLPPVPGPLADSTRSQQNQDVGPVLARAHSIPDTSDSDVTVKSRLNSTVLYDIQHLRPTHVQTAGMIWKGFSHEWQRSLLGFETPHRLGSFCNGILDVNATSFGGHSAVTGIVNTTFTPGVNGDYAYPTTYLSGWGRYNGFDKILGGKTQVEYSFTDHSTQTAVPTANTSLRTTAIIDMSNFATAEAALVSISGLRIDMHCNPELQPPHDICNSNGIWPSRLWVEIEQCDAGSDSAGMPILNCTISMDLFRSWTPTHGGGKPFNYAMTFNISVYLSIVGGLQSNFAATIGDPVMTDSEIHQGVSAGGSSINGQVGYPNATTTIQGFGFQLKYTKGHPNLGRYLEHLVFHVSDAGYSPQTGVMNYKFQTGYVSPSTVDKADVEYFIKPGLLQFVDEALAMTPEQSVNGTICVSGPTFKCASKHLQNDHNDAVPVTIPLV